MFFTAIFQHVLSIPPFPAIRRRLSETPVLKRLARGVYWTMVGNFTWRILSLISTVMVARVLGREAFGEFGMLRSTVDLLTVFAGYRFGSLATKYVAEYRKKDPRKAAAVLQFASMTALTTCSMLLVAICLSSSWIAAHCLNRPSLSLPIIIGGIFIVASTLGGCSEGALSGFESFKNLAVVNFWKGMIPVLICAPTAYFWGVSGVQSAWVVTAALGWMASSFYLRRERGRSGFPKHVPFAEIRKETPLLWTFLLPGILEGMIITGAMWMARAYLARQPDGYAQMGIFAAAEQWRNVVLFLPVVLGRVVLPLLADAYGNESSRKFEDMLSLQIRVIWLIALPLTVLVIGLADPLSAVFGKQFHGSEDVMSILMVSVFFFCVNAVEKQALITTNRNWVNFLLMGGWAVILLSATAFLAPSLGARGFALANLISYGALSLALMLYTNQFVAPGIIYRHLGFYAWSLLLLTAAFFAKQLLPDTIVYPTTATLLLLALGPLAWAVRRAKA